MDPKTKIKSDLVQAMKAKDTERVSVIRMVQAELQKREIDKRAPLSEDEFLKLVSTLIKQRRESEEAFKKGGREDLAEKESREAEMLQGYLPPQLSDEELESIVVSAISETGATSVKEMGKVMQAVMPKVAGRADGKRINKIVQSKLA
ncbi:MAG: GatB/YqeY domain-containing protein [Bdellovibrionales bacterium]|nr:GatB/YqeY domain-containing protein [Bdellovibrionales bacterium]MCB0417929.1 GatB/YqeY domain-containing protein [Bdellovibrionales bacterium]